MDNLFEMSDPVSAGEVAASVLSSIEQDVLWDGKQISASGIYRGIPIESYHQKPDLLDGPSVSKSGLKHIVPPLGGSPKAFWGRWAQNPDRRREKPRKATEFGKAVHMLLLGEDTFRDCYVIRPDEAPDGRAWNGNNKSCKDWLAEQELNGLSVITAEEVETIRRMADDASNYDLVKQGLLNGRIERSMFWRDQRTGIWVRARPDVVPSHDGIFVDLKTTSSLDEDFLERQIGDLGYFLQAAMTRMVCRGLGIPFERFVFLYVLNDDVPDTGHVELNDIDIDRGEAVIRWALDTIRECLDTGYWPGKEPFDRGEKTIQMKPWLKTKIDDFLTKQSDSQELVA